MAAVDGATATGDTRDARTRFREIGGRVEWDSSGIIIVVRRFRGAISHGASRPVVKAQLMNSAMIARGTRGICPEG